MAQELRCGARIHGILREDGLFEVKCSAGTCGAKQGVAVFHYFDITTGDLVETKMYRTPQVGVKEKEGRANAAYDSTPAVRSA